MTDLTSTLPKLPKGYRWNVRSKLMHVPNLGVHSESVLCIDQRDRLTNLWTQRYWKRISRNDTAAVADEMLDRLVVDCLVDAENPRQREYFGELACDRGINVSKMLHAVKN